MPLKLVAVHENDKTVEIDFIGGKSKAQPLFFWMFNLALDYLIANEGRYIWLGTDLKPPYKDDTIERTIWKDQSTSPYKVAPFICDFLVLSGVAEYGYARNPETAKEVQVIRYIHSPTQEPGKYLPMDPTIPGKIEAKTVFLRKYQEAILKWSEENEDKIIEGRAGYSSKNKPTLECVKSRNDVSREIVLSRIRNGGGVDLETLDKVTMWGFDRRFPLRDPDEALRITTEAFNHLDVWAIREAILTLLQINGVGISRASKIIGLFDQENLCIYDSRVGNALKTLKYQGEKIILCPPGQNRNGDLNVGNPKWAEHYERLIWTLEVIQDDLNQKGCTYRLADVEMALFMMGK